MHGIDHVLVYYDTKPVLIVATPSYAMGLSRVLALTTVH